jgi:hypothetical protein
MVIHLPGDKVAAVQSGSPGADRRRHPGTLAEPRPRSYVEVVPVIG